MKFVAMVAIAIVVSPEIARRVAQDSDFDISNFKKTVKGLDDSESSFSWTVCSTHNPPPGGREGRAKQARGPRTSIV